MIIKYANIYNADVILALNISYAESWHKNIPNYMYDEKHTAYGIFQETETFYRNNCGDPEERKDVELNIKCAMKVLSQPLGFLHWMESYDLGGNGWKWTPYTKGRSAFDFQFNSGLALNDY